MEITATKATFQKYPAYKDSGVEWLGKIPTNWDVLPLFALTKLKSISNCPDLELLSVYLDLGVIRFSDIEAKRTNATSLDLSKYQKVEPGDFVLNNQQAWRGSVGVSNYEGIVSPAYIILSLSHKLNPSFANYYFRNGAMVSQYLISSKGVGTIQRNLYWPQLRRTYVGIPPKEEQTAIANFLDDKTAKIDRAIAQKEQLIALLKERKQIIIQNAVTKGLDPNVKLKDSGVEWIGEIPEGWEVTKFKNQIRLRHGHQFLDHDFTEEGIDVVKITQLHKDGYLDLSKATKVSYHLLKKYNDILIKKGDVLMCLTGGTIGKIIRVGEIDRPLLQNYRVGHFSSAMSEQIDNDYIFYLMSSEMLQAQIYLDLGETGQPNIGMEDMKNMIICVPAKDEQRKIVTYLEGQIQKADSIISLQQTQIEKLKEYKATLIDSAVTGKIKVV